MTCFHDASNVFLFIQVLCFLHGNKLRHTDGVSTSRGHEHAYERQVRFNIKQSLLTPGKCTSEQHDSARQQCGNESAWPKRKILIPS
jgi:hypothetical protein